MKALRSLGKKITLALVSAILALGQPAFAQPTSTINNWEYPGRFKFTGTPEKACDIFVGFGLLKTACLTAVDLKEKGGCEEFYLQDGDIITTTFSSARGHGANTLRVNFKDEQGQPVPADHEMRRAHRCATGIPGIVIVFPEVCGNWSIMTREVPPVHEVKLEEPPPPQQEWVCSVEYFHDTGGGHGHLHLPGVYIPGCPDVFVGGLFVNGGSSQSRGYSQSCGWVTVN